MYYRQLTQGQHQQTDANLIGRTKPGEHCETDGRKSVVVQ